MIRGKIRQNHFQCAKCKNYGCLSPNLDNCCYQCSKGRIYLYAIECGKYIKVGYSSRLKYRLMEIQIHNPNECKILYKKLFSKLAAQGAESKIKELLSKYRHVGEWYKSCTKSKSLLKSFYSSDSELSRVITGNGYVSDNVCQKIIDKEEQSK